MARFHPLYLIPIACFCIAGYGFYSLNVLGNNIIDDLNTPFDDPLLKDYNHDLTCFKVGLYTNWDDGVMDEFFDFVTMVDPGEHARKKFFEYGCNCHDETHGMKNWRTDRMCLPELYK